MDLPITFPTRRAVLTKGTAIGLVASGLVGCTQSIEPDTVEVAVNDVTLTRNDIVVRIAPDLGGSVTHFRKGDRHILRPTPSNATEARETANFVMVPVVNRIPDGRFIFDGRQVDLAGNFLGLADHIHGYGWRAAWQVERRSSDRATLVYSHAPDEWPWAFIARQNFILNKTGLRIELSVTNQSDTPMPAQLGFHPFFPVTPATQLRTDYDGHWINNEFGHAIRQVEGSSFKDFTRGAELVDERMLDTTHYGWSGHAVLSEPGQSDIVITASSLADKLHIFFPPNGHFAAIEPVAGRSNALPSGSKPPGPRDYEIVEPDATIRIWMQIDVEDTE